MSLAALTTAIRAAATEHGLYSRAELSVTIVAHMSRWLLTVTTPHTNRTRSIPVTDDVFERTGELREQMARPWGVGTWFAATITLTPEGDPVAVFDYDSRPVWLTPRDEYLEAVAFARDLDRFPRSPDCIPPWLADVLAVAATPRRDTRVRAYWSGPDSPTHLTT